MQYEVDFVFLGQERGMEALFSTLTGLDPQDISPHMKDRFRGSDFIRIFRELGYNTNPRFCKFDPDTPYPIVLRCKEKQESSWYCLVYHQRKIYNPWSNEVISLDDRSKVRKMNGKYFITFYGLKITSMLQVWI